jgi:magnesium chelatase subunit I
MQRGLMIAAVDPLVGGVLILGDRGTGKSTAVRALAAVLPPIRAVTECAYRCEPQATAGLCARCQGPGRKRPAAAETAVPVVDLPLGATEDRILGALDLERLMVAGEKVYEPGLLARANRGFLYIDEVNLLEDHLVDLLIDAAASGENRIERESLSIVHPARFVLVGSGNPEEGELRPQLLDRFGLAVEVRTPQDIDERIEVIRRREAFERDPEAFLAQYRTAQEALRTRLAAARKSLGRVGIDDARMRQVAMLCQQLGTDGLRGELSLMRAAKAAAAIDGARSVAVDHLREVAPMALRHRLRRDPLDETDASGRVARAIGQVLGEAA